MLRSLRHLERYTIAATDGDVGTVADFLFDDERWAVRYLVAETGGFFGGRRVLVSPLSFRQADWATSSFHVQLTMDRVRSSPSTDVDKPVSRQHEIDYSRHYNYPYYWGYTGVWGLTSTPMELASSGNTDGHAGQLAPGDSHLRSVNEVRGYEVVGSDAPIGHVQDFIVDDETWQLRYIVIDTGGWWSGKRVLIAPHWASRISWEEQRVYFHAPRDMIRSSPEWNAEAAVNRAYEARLYDYYGRPVYWSPGSDGNAPRSTPAP